MNKHTVAPRVGAWIEKCMRSDVRRLKGKVAPRVGAWIENTVLLFIKFTAWYVAPRVGAWIEKFSRSLKEKALASRSSRRSVD